ncbi:prostaglandin E receptor 4 (subtype EP4) c [Salminus brasiliensis]|uniref:prostaglandin E receptor 4 (subtype EP4) c n=1 Tax=Salminus brasiliensis TaxID=930266 RepID=UPI003B8394DC
MNDSVLLADGGSPRAPLRLDVRSLVTSASMFAVGVLGNVVAAAVLCASRREQKETAFYTLVCGMAVTDLLGTCFTSPVVIATYVAGRWPGGTRLCHFFSFSMLFFGSAGMSILCAMAVERYVAIDHAYFYSKRVDRRTARAALLAAYAANAALCALPSLGFGRHARHVPGTWCFLDWRATDPAGAAYSYLYGGVMLALVAVTVVCNCAACRSLVRMSRETRAGGTGRRALAGLPAVTSAAEIQMFWMLIIMTVVFLICSIPLVVRIFVNQIYGPTEIAAGMKPDYRSDLLAIRFASFNPILDPWVYILCRRNLFTKICEWLKRTVGHSREGHERTLGWVGGQHSPPSLTHSNDTSYASFRMVTCRNAAGTQAVVDTRPYENLTLRQAWEFDTAMDNFHPFSVEQEPVLGFESETASSSKVDTIGSAGCVGTPTSGAKLHGNKTEMVTCTFSTPSSCLSEKSVG